MLSDQLLRSMVDAMPMPVFVKDGTDRYLYVNRAFETLFHVRSESIVGRPVAGSPESERTVDLLRPSLPMWSSRLTESATFVTSTGERLTMGVVSLGSEPTTRRDEGARRRNTDPVTDCVGERALQAHAEDAFSAAAGVLRISVDGYERLGAAAGTDVADSRLAEFSRIVRDNIRPGDVFARIGVSDFTLVLWGADREQTALVARRVSTLVTEAQNSHDEGSIGLSIAVGTAFSDEDDEELFSVIEKAEQSLQAVRPRIADALSA